MITVGIPTYNEENSIARAINSVLFQISLEDEVIVIASGCVDNTVDEINKVMERDKRVRLVIQRARKGKASALNLMIKKAHGDIIVQTDGDVEVDRAAIDNLLKPFKNPKVGAVSGNPIPIISKSNLFYDWTQMSYRKIGEIREKESKEGFCHLSGYLLAFRKEALKEIPFAKGAIDAVMGNEVRKAGWRIDYAPDALVYVKTPLTIRDFIAQKARVRAGYAALKDKPRTAGSEMLYFPKELLKIPVGRWPKFIICAFVYAYCWAKGWYMTKTNKTLQQIWKVPESTK